jgi:hypothetical protein
VAAVTEPEEGLREQLQNRYGDAGLVELALAISSSQVYPITKRALGYATSCAKVTLNFDE